jgi:hypothetical protein
MGMDKDREERVVGERWEGRVVEWERFCGREMTGRGNGRAWAGEMGREG